MTARRILPLVLLAVLATASAVAAQTRPAQFFLTGPIQSFTLDAGDLLTGGSMVVEGTTVTIPRNLIVQMPATFLTPKDIFDLNPGNPAESGLAINDSAPRPGDYQASIVGNIVGSQHVAGLVWISQDPLAEGAGYIKSIAANGEITLVADPTDAAPQPETRIRINDPDSVFAPQDPNLDSDPRFMVDGENPTIMSMSGYPMCIPRAANDPECPDANRPEDAGKPLSRFIMGPADLAIAPAGSPPLPKCPACMPEKQAPMRPGDYIIYAGTLARDGADIYISAHTIQANVGIYTQPGVAPAYIAIEGSLLGTMGPRILRDPAVPNDFIDQETQDRLRVEGATTDPTLGIDIYAIDVDPSGNESVRFLSSAPRKEPPYGRFNLVLGKNANALFDGNGVSRGAVREILVRLARNGRLPDGAPVPSGPTFANGLVAGQYRAPVGEFIFPENKSVGEQILPNNFECLPFLVTGTGNLTTNGHNGPDQVGQLDPWPGDPVPAAVPASIFCGP